MKRFIFSFLLVFLSIASSRAVDSGPEGKQTVDPQFEDWGNSCRTRGVSVSSNTMTPIVISTYPSNANLGISAWRYREIINVSTGSSIRLIFNEDPFKLYSSTYGVVISSDITGRGFGDKYVDRSQAKIEAIQSSNIGIGGAGVVITEYYYKP